MAIVTFQGLRSHTALATVMDSTAVIVEYSRGWTVYEGAGREPTGVRRKHQEDGGGWQHLPGSAAIAQWCLQKAALR